jgi:2-alkenal reductase
MRARSALIFCLISVAAFAVETVGCMAAQGLTDTERMRVELFERAGPSVVHVAVQRPRPSHGEYGAGITWDHLGHVVTNNHVVKDASSIAIVLPSGKLFSARVVGTSINYDLAVLQIDGHPSDLPPPLTLGRSDNLQVGQSVFAIGNPFGFDQTLTIGIVSALKSRMRIDDSHELANAIQLGASINPGDSGGPVLDSSGEVIGMTTATVSASGGSSGLGFAIPAETLNRVVPQLIESGKIKRPTIGIVPAAEARSVIQRVRGIAIAKVMPGSPADKAGLRGTTDSGAQPSDIITAANGRDVTRLADLVEELWSTGIGRSIKLVVSRDGQSLALNLPIVDGRQGF